MSSQTTHTMLFTQIIAFKSHLENLGKPVNLKTKSVTLLNLPQQLLCSSLAISQYEKITTLGQGLNSTFGICRILDIRCCYHQKQIFITSLQGSME